MTTLTIKSITERYKKDITKFKETNPVGDFVEPTLEENQNAINSQLTSTFEKMCNLFVVEPEDFDYHKKIKK